MDEPFDYVSVEVEVRDLGDPIGSGLFLLEPVPAGAHVATFGGCPVSLEEFRTLSDFQQRHAIQVDDEVYIVGGGTRHAIGDYINHSCDPTLWLFGQITLVARRDLAAGEQLTYDYATSDASPYDEFECLCNMANCREKVTGEDWMDPELQARYRGHFSPYIERRFSGGNA